MRRLCADCKPSHALIMPWSHPRLSYKLPKVNDHLCGNTPGSSVLGRGGGGAKKEGALQNVGKKREGGQVHQDRPGNANKPQSHR